MNTRTSEAIDELEKSIYSVLETYSNVHRGSRLIRHIVDTDGFVDLMSWGFSMTLKK
jgi:hypothetical protein